MTRKKVYIGALVQHQLQQLQFLRHTVDRCSRFRSAFYKRKHSGWALINILWFTFIICRVDLCGLVILLH